MGKTKHERGLCDVKGCYEKAVVKWTTGGGTNLYVCKKHDDIAEEQMGFAYLLLDPLPIR